MEKLRGAWCEGEHLRPLSRKSSIQLSASKAEGSGFVEAVVGLAVWKRHGEIGPGLRATMPDGIDAPVNAHTELHILKGFIGARGAL